MSRKRMAGASDMLEEIELTQNENTYLRKELEAYRVQYEAMKSNTELRSMLSKTPSDSSEAVAKLLQSDMGGIGNKRQKTEDSRSGSASSDEFFQIQKALKLVSDENDGLRRLLNVLKENEDTIDLGMSTPRITLFADIPDMSPETPSPKKRVSLSGFLARDPMAITLSLTRFGIKPIVPVSDVEAERALAEYTAGLDADGFLNADGIEDSKKSGGPR
ncbi:MAG: hypothetical protein P1U63_12735 [Coxiellaceae bacterium]|nr:hypothetical protein [Coxiellaceae bacterium]